MTDVVDLAPSPGAEPSPGTDSATDSATLSGWFSAPIGAGAPNGAAYNGEIGSVIRARARGAGIDCEPLDGETRCGREILFRTEWARFRLSTSACFSVQGPAQFGGRAP